MTSVSGKAFDIPILKRVFTLVKPYPRVFFLSCVLTISAAFLSPLRPYLVQLTLDKYVALGDYSGLQRMMLILLGLLLTQAAVQYYQTYLTNLLGQQVVQDLRVKLFRHILDFRLGYFDRTPIGTLQTRTISDMETISDIFSEGLIVIIGDILQLIVVLSMMFYVDWRLTLISLSTIPLLLVATNIFKNGIKNSFQEVRTQLAHLNTFVQEHLTGMSIVQIFNREERELENFKEINKKHADANIRSVWYYSVFFPVVEILSAASVALLVWWGMEGVLAGHSTFGSIVAFIIYINMVFRPIRELADKFNTLQMGMVSSERIFKVMDTQASISNEGVAIAENIIGEIVFEHVWFAYQEEDWVLRDVSFRLSPGKTMAIVGATGSGKSTIINLLCRFYEFQKGRITIDGVDIRAYELASLRSAIGVVLQDVFLFSDTVSNNISLRNESIDEAMIKDAAVAIGAHAFIERLPGGYNYNVQERGATLSVGQRQLIAFIRAYVYNPALLVLDEATSSIDSESEQLIQRATEKLTSNRTSIVIAHRLATILNADQIMVMDHGQILESGTHKELLGQDGAYKKLYEIQFRSEVVGEKNT